MKVGEWAAAGRGQAFSVVFRGRSFPNQPPATKREGGAMWIAVRHHRFGFSSFRAEEKQKR
jgi:hypothetical protein